MLRGGAAMLPVIGPACVSVEPGDVPLATLMQMDPGIIVTRFSGSSNPISGDFSGVVKGGFLVKGGEKIPIQETTVAGNLYECLQRISGISQEVQVFGEPHPTQPFALKMSPSPLVREADPEPDRPRETQRNSIRNPS